MESPLIEAVVGGEHEELWEDQDGTDIRAALVCTSVIVRSIPAEIPIGNTSHPDYQGTSLPSPSLHLFHWCHALKRRLLGQVERPLDNVCLLLGQGASETGRASVHINKGFELASAK